MSTKYIEQISCSLNLGLIYSIDYNYSPSNGVEMSVFFVSENGQYAHPRLMQKASVQIGNASFSLYVVASKISLSSGRRVIQVTFVDEFFKLEHYYVVLTGKGCGKNVFELGEPVDNRSNAEKRESALVPVAVDIKSFTQFSDIEYGFNDFLKVLRSVFTVNISANFDTTVKRNFTGTFKEVLDSWCNLFNFSYFYESGVIKIFDLVSLIINLPSVPIDAISSESEQDARSTYGKTVFNWFQQEGGQKSLNQSGTDSRNKYFSYLTLWPFGYEFNLTQPTLDINQVTAAQFGQEFWFLYNYRLGSTEVNCGWKQDIPTNAETLVSLAHGGLNRALLNETIFNQKFESFYQYGQGIAGRVYLSNELGSAAELQTYTWQDVDSTIQAPVTLTWQSPPNHDGGINIIPETFINKYFPGINYVGDRAIYTRTTPITTGTFAISETLRTDIVNTFQTLFNSKGSASLNIGGTESVTYYAGTISDPIVAIIDSIPEKSSIFNFNPNGSFRLKGIKTTDYITKKVSDDQGNPDEVKIVNTLGGSNVVSNTAVIKALVAGNYTIFYDKYSLCGSASSYNNNYFQHKFEPYQISSDIAISFNFNKNAKNTYTLNRDYSTINKLVNNQELLLKMATPRTFNGQTVSFSVNYFMDVPINFLTAGLISLSVSIGGDGVVSSYTYSNDVLRVPTYNNNFEKFQQQTRNSWIRQYHPDEVITDS